MPSFFELSDLKTAQPWVFGLRMRHTAHLAALAAVFLGPGTELGAPSKTAWELGEVGMLLAISTNVRKKCVNRIKRWLAIVHPCLLKDHGATSSAQKAHIAIGWF